MATPDATREDTSRRNASRLILLRNVEILGIAAGIAIAVGYFGMVLPLQPLFIILALIVTLNIVAWQRLRSGARIGDTGIFIQMLLDVAGLTGIFFYTGGASNPFVWFYLLPLMIAATILPRAHTWIMAVITVICYSSLFLIDAPLDSGNAHHDPASGFQMHVFGMWLGFVMSAGFVAVIIVGMAHTLRQRDRRLAEAREQALQNERLVALGTLAAGAAHELGTPLGTMAILTSELEQEYLESSHSDLHGKLAILREQVDRCKDALSVISADAGADRAESGHSLPVRAYLSEVINEWQSQRPGASLDVHIDEHAPDADILAERMLTQALINILNNAEDASPDDVRLESSWTLSELSLTIADRGTGIDADIQNQLGKTPVSTKNGGLGVGLYLAHATLQRLGGNVTVQNRHDGGTLTHITLPLLPGKGKPVARPAGHTH
ncbi:MAG: ATP-binding protein [Pseudomonadota bacterium]